MSGPFAEAAPLYSDLGLVPVPLKPDKTPAVRGWHKHGPHSWKRLVDRYGDCNIGALNGRGSLPITVVDIDDPDERGWCHDRFGDTPVKVRTPSGGEHWYFRANGEHRRTRLEGHKVDILGLGGYGVLPPSRTPHGAYAFLTGDEWDFHDLPVIKGLGHEQSQVSDGRNNSLFNELRVIAANTTSHDELLEEARKRNALFAEPMVDGEVQSIVKSVWRYKSEGALLLPGCEPVVRTTASVLDACSDSPDALYLWSTLERYHGAKHGEPFKLANATAAKLGWSTRRFRKARDYLIEVGLLELMQQGQQGRKHATVVRLADQKMVQIDPQYNQTVSPLS